MKKLTLLSLLLIFTFSVTKSVTLSPQARISLLTCAPGDEIYSYFGHSAIRVNDPSLGIDVAFNYGVFDFMAPHFVWRFIKGETDYLLYGFRMDAFMDEYRQEKRAVYEQKLRLTGEEAQRLFDALVDNAKPENRIYRYKHFSDNCATRVRDQFEHCIPQGLIYDKTDYKVRSFRQLVDQYVPDNSWSGLGIKLALGIPCDKIADYSQQQFLPDYLMHAMAKAKVKRETGLVDFVEPITSLYDPQRETPGFDFGSPSLVILVIFTLVLGATVLELRKGSVFWGIDFAIFLSYGLAGIILGFLCFFSVLEATGQNLNLIWAFPGHALFALLLLLKGKRYRLMPYYFITGAVLILFLGFMAFLPQTFHWLVIPLSLILWLRCFVNYKLKK